MSKPKPGPVRTWAEMTEEERASIHASATPPDPRMADDSCNVCGQKVEQLKSGRYPRYCAECAKMGRHPGKGAKSVWGGWAMHTEFRRTLGYSTAASGGPEWKDKE